MGEGDPPTVIYVNFTSKKIPEKFNARVKELDSMMKLTHQWLDTHAGLQVKARKAEGEIASDDSPEAKWKRSDYRIKVVDTYLTENCSWVYTPRSEKYTKSIKARKVDFHFELVKNVLAGLIVPTSLTQQLEAIFKGISDTVMKTQHTAEKRAVWSLIQVYTYDEMRDDVRCSLRCISYSIDQDMKKIIVGKASYESISLDFSYLNGDYHFNEDTWKEVKSEVNQFITGRAVKQIRDTTKVPV
ncbi:predicted protein [Uncinocarpus reesii 1704]|uniref:Uncharacterized protein n=1 Tax=Uncinocarpus reesii (strain UAMH 1704) TaxID=336963 RepID=C4JU75_UNCRE|nr:uncharacterized protein UREG_06014 [Uncinocarpus reesii 1704]EEP81172.1 predicted protein [Uncinocarpus reesii 1704]